MIRKILCFFGIHKPAIEWVQTKPFKSWKQCVYCKRKKYMTWGKVPFKTEYSRWTK